MTVVDHATGLARNLGLLTAQPSDLIADRVRMINRRRDLMTTYFQRNGSSTTLCKGALVLLTGYAAPDRLRRMGEARLAGWLRGPRVRGYAQIAARAVAAARVQQVALRAKTSREDRLRHRRQRPDLDERLKELDAQIAATSTCTRRPRSASPYPFGPFPGGVAGPPPAISAPTRARPPAPRPGSCRPETTPAGAFGNRTSLTDTAVLCARVLPLRAKPA